MSRLGRIVATMTGRALRRLRRSWLRSEEHTSELQSQSNLVCRLLLEKKTGETSNPSEPRPTGTFVTSHDFWLPLPGGGPAGGVPPGGGPNPLFGCKTNSTMLIVAELTFEVTILSRLGATQTMCVLSWPVPITQSISFVEGL